MHKFLLTILLIAALAFTDSCGTGDQVRAKTAMEASQAAYEKCLQQNPDDASKCEPLKRAYEADCMAYQEASKRRGPTTTIFMEMGPGK
ncbi:MAG: hypothetical protein WCD80_05175 [Desulfobaccales bacterium]